MPALASAAIYLFTIGFGTFDIPAIIGWSNRIFTFSTYVFLLTSPQEGLPAYGQAAALSSFLIVLAIGLAGWSAYITRDTHKFAVVTGKGYRPRLVTLKKWKLVAGLLVSFYVLVAIVLPLAAIVWTSLLPYLQLPSSTALALVSFRNYRSVPWYNFFEAFKNTAMLAILVPLVVLLFSFAFSWIRFRTTLRGRVLFDIIAFIPHVVPSIIFSAGILMFVLYVIERVVHIYGTWWILMLAFVGIWLSYGTRMTNASLIQIHRDLEESALVSGAATLAVVRLIDFPLMSRGLLLAWIYLVILTTRELTLTVILTTPGNTTVPAMIWNMWLAGDIGKSTAAVVCFVLGMMPLMLIYSVCLHRSGVAAGATPAEAPGVKPEARV
jgi:iron(III) transport system permease protein